MHINLDDTDLSEQCFIAWFLLDGTQPNGSTHGIRSEEGLASELVEIEKVQISSEKCMEPKYLFVFSLFFRHIQ